MCDPATFVSSIKVKGIHLLPPVITPKRRTELEKDRQQAIKLEKRLENTRKLKSDLEELLTLNSLSDKQPAFSNSHSKKPNLSKEILEISEYRNDIKTFSSDFSTVSGSSKSHVNSSSQQDVDDSSIKTNASSIISCDVNDINSASSSTSKLDICPALNLSKLSSTSGSKTPSPHKSPKPRMIRSNSYTLEAPSPILLAHLENCSKTAIDDTAEHEDAESLHRSLWGSLDNNYVPFEQSQFSSLNTVYNFNENNSEESKAATNTVKDEVTKEPSPSIEVVQTDISVQQITVNANTEELQPVKTTIELTDPDCQLMQVLKKIPAEYSKQIIELIEKQKSDHSLKVDKFSKQFCSTPKSMDDTRPATASPSQSLYYSFSSSDTIVPTSPFSKTPYSEYCDDNGSFNKYQNVVKKIKNQSECRGKMFHTSKNIDAIKEEWAASVVCAHVKGYLTRRLLKTETVQSVIDTIKHALQCALELHNIDNIDESDIELHRRLINQVSAACYEFHDIFFSLSTKEQMNIIAADRKRLTEKNRRAKSGSNIKRSVSNSSRSSIRSRTSLMSTKSN
ncbi:unnamed protein product [Phyllotreta striolata]|uniref:Uncharacterized protein n=1 Tax=Phyllotreta striolata TaxID=444603 RepID=A0A9N9XKJ7_PHYSR|nr:unnamed protein product [Phyllotreta striolata]